MANTASMGPPPSPKEPRRSGRRSAPSTSKSPAGSPTSDTSSNPKDSSSRPPQSSSTSSNKKKRSKHEDAEDPTDDAVSHTSTTTSTTNGRTKRKAKDKDVGPLPQGAPDEEVIPASANGDTAADPQEEEEEQGITRCICDGTGEEDGGEYMAMCEICHTWQHGFCMGYNSVDEIPDEYFCERCRPDMYPELLKKHAKRARHSSTTSHHNAAPRSSRSHSPSHLKSHKRRNTMNSRDAAAYEENLQAALQVSVADVDDSSTHPADGDGASATAQQDGDPDFELTLGGRKKRKRGDYDSASTKRNRSESILSDRTSVHHAMRDPTPMSAVSIKTPTLPLPPPSKTNSRAKRGGGRKAQAQPPDPDGEEGASNTGNKRQGNTRGKGNANYDHGTRRNQTNGVNGHNSGPHSASHSNSNNAPSRGGQHSRDYRDIVAQQPLYISWNLPDYLSHLEPMLPTATPEALKVRGFTITTSNSEPTSNGDTSNGGQRIERPTDVERGVKVKWPSKRMSMGDMNKRVRALVEWVGREQASTSERCRRREAIEKGLKEALQNASDVPEGERMAVDGSGLNPSNLLFDDGKNETMKVMEELMEELINFQERFGPGAGKGKERRTAST